MVKYSCLAAILCMLASPTLACAMLLQGDPKVGSEVAGPVDHVTLKFSSKIYPEQSTLVVTDALGNTVSTGKAYGDDTTLTVKTTTLEPGKYKVSWNTWCDCKSYTPGDYKFTVRQ